MNEIELRDIVACAMCAIKECGHKPQERKYSMCSLYIKDADVAIATIKQNNYFYEQTDWVAFAKKQLERG